MINNIVLSFTTLSSDSELIANAGVVSTVLVAIGLFSLFANAIWWFWHILHMEDKDVTIKTYLCSAYVVITVVFLLGDWVPTLIPAENGDAWSSSGLSYLTCYSYLMASCNLCLTVVSAYCAKIDATQVRR